MPVLVFAVLLLALPSHSSGNWCVCKEGISDVVLQKTLDYACGAGADCKPIHQPAPCFQPNTVKAHCSYAVNSYFQRKNQAMGTCDFSGTAILSTSDPSASGCSYPSNIRAAGSIVTTPTPMNGATPTSRSPYSTMPSNGVLGGDSSSSGLGGINTDYIDGGFRVVENKWSFLLISFVLAAHLLLS